MPASGTVTPTTSVDLTAAQLVAEFGQGDSLQYSVVTRIQLSLGPEPSCAICELPTLSGADHAAPEVTGTANMNWLKIGTPASIYCLTSSGRKVLYLTGRVRDISQDLDKDVVVAEVVDVRWLLSRLRLVGSFWADTSSSGEERITYRQGWHPIVNPRGQPNMMWRTVGDDKLPFFCLPNAGIPVGFTPPRAELYDTNFASMWEPWCVAMYIRYACSFDAYTKANESATFSEYAWADDNMQWPTDYARALPTQGKASKERNLAQAKVSHLLDDVLQEGGDFGLSVLPFVGDDGEGGQTMSCSIGAGRTRFEGTAGIVVQRASGDAADAFGQPLVVTAGSIRESGINYHTDFSVTGNLVFIERRVDSTTPSSTGLRPAWSADDEEEWSTIYNAADSHAEGIENANREYPGVWASYRLDPDFDFQAGTSQSGYPRSTTARPVLPSLLSSYLENEQGTDATDQKRFRRPVLVEYHNGTAWLVAAYLDGFEIDGDGTLTFHGLREQGQTYRRSGTLPEATFSRNNLRMTLAIPCDHRLTARSTPASTESGADSGRVDDSLYIPYSSDCGENAGLEIRKNSWPRPQAAGGTQASDGTLLDQSALLADAIQARQRDYGRIDRTGTLYFPYISPVWLPGVRVKSLGDYPIRSVITAMTIVSQGDRQFMEAHLS